MKKKYSISIRFGNDIYEGKGETALEALKNLEQPVKIFQKGIITIKVGNKTREMWLMPHKIKRFWWKTAQPLIAKNIESGLMGVKV